MQVLDRAAISKMQKVRLVGKDANEIVNAIEALMRAEDIGMDLVLVSDQVEPPVVRIQDYKKIQYEKKKAKKTGSQRKSALKEIQFKANISDHDFEVKMNRIKAFIERGDKVKVIVRLKGRERETPERALAIIDRVASTAEGCKVSKVPGPMAIAILEPVSKK